MPVSGSFAELTTLRNSLGLLARGVFASRVLPPLAEAAVTQVRRGFRGSVDPYGNAWLPLRWRKGKPLRDTGQGANSFTGIVDAKGFRVESNVEHLMPHQEGATINRGANVTARTGSGRFNSHKRAGKAKRSVRVAFGSGSHFQIPARPMVPDDRGLPERWRTVFEREAKRTITVLMKGG